MPAHPLAWVPTVSRFGWRSITCPTGCGYSLKIPARNALAAALRLRARLAEHYRTSHPEKCRDLGITT